MKVTWDSVQQLVRIVAQFIGGYLVSQGLITEGMVSEFVGGILSLGAIAWWVFWNGSRKDKPPVST